MSWEAIGNVGSDVLGAVFGAASARKQHRVAKQFAQNAIQWRVNDAKAAGIHPLYALGAQVSAGPPIGTGSEGLGSSLGSIGRAIDDRNRPGMTEDEKKAVTLDLEHRGLQNDLLRAQIAKLTNADKGIPGQGGDVVKAVTPKELVTMLGKLGPGPQNFSDAEDVEQRYGEIVSEVQGMRNLMDDVYGSINRDLVNQVARAVGGVFSKKYPKTLKSNIRKAAKSWSERR